MADETREFKFDSFLVKCCECKAEARVFIEAGKVVIKCGECGQETGEEVKK